MTNSTDLIHAWREELKDQTVVSALRVQDKLLGLWSEIDGEVDAVLATWLEASRHRDLFSADELQGLLDEVDSISATA